MANDVCHNMLRMCTYACVCVCVPLALALARATNNTWPSSARPSTAQLSSGQAKWPHTPRCRHRPRHISDIYTSQQFQTADDIVSLDFLPLFCPLLAPPLTVAGILDTLQAAKSVIIIFIVNILRHMTSSSKKYCRLLLFPHT